MKNIIWINGMPRSGTSWLSQIFDSNPNISFKLSPLFSYQFKNEVNELSPKNEWDSFFKKVFTTEDEFINQTYRRNSGEYPYFKKFDLERLVIKDTRYHNLTNRLLDLYDDIQFIHIIRNPCGAINSWLKAPREFPQNLDVLSEWRTGNCRKTGREEFWGFDDWLLLTKKYLRLQKKYPKQVKVVFYDTIVENLMEEVKSMFNFVNVNFTKQTLDFIKKSQSIHNDSEYSVYKSKNVVNKWKKELSPKIIEEIIKDMKENNLDNYFDLNH